MSPSPSRPVFSGAKWWVLFLSFKGRGTLGKFLKRCPMPNDSVYSLVSQIIHPHLGEIPN